MAIPRIQRIAATLSQPQLTSSDRRAALVRYIGNEVHPYKALNDLAEAISIVADEEIRADLGRLLWAQLNTPRIVVGKDLPSHAPLVTAVLFTVDKPSVLLGEPAQPLFALTGPLDQPMFLLKDPLQPDIAPLLLVVPLPFLNLSLGFALNYILGNPLRTEMDDAYKQAWDGASSAPATASNTFVYLFLSTTPGTTFAQATHPSATPDLGPRTQSILDLISRHANKLNLEHPDLNMQVVEVCSLSRAVLKGAELRIRKAMQDQKHLLGQFITDDPLPQPDPHDIVHADLLQEALENFRATYAGKRQTPEEIFGKAIIGMASSPETGSEQIGQCLMLSSHGVPNICMSVALPQGITTSMLSDWWRETIDPERRAQLVQLPSVSLAKLPCNTDGQSLYRDETGEWCELSLLKLADARKLFKTATWAQAIKAQQIALGSPEQLVEVPHPRLFLQAVNLEQAVRSHFAPQVAQTLLTLASQPGRSHSWMRDQMLDSHIELLGAQSVLPHPTDAFMPEGFWAALHFQRASGVVFRLRSTFQQEMEDSDFKGSFPFYLLRAPYPDIYIQFAKPLPLNNETVLGAYCSDFTHSEQECIDDGVPIGTRTFSLMLAITHQGGLSPKMIGCNYTIAPEDDVDLASKLRQAMKSAVDASILDTAPEGAPPISETEQESKRFEAVIFLILKTLLYISMKSARTELHLDASAFLERAKAAKGKERDKLLRKAFATYDHIVIGPEVSEADQKQRASAEYMKSVWPVRGYFQPVRFGPGRQQLRPHWHPPSFRHRHALESDDVPPPPKDYDVK